MPDSVLEFAKEYKYVKDFPAAKMPEYAKCSRKWLDTCNYYESKYNEYQAEKLKNG